MAGKPKLHEILAVEGDANTTAEKLLEEAVATFTKRGGHFQETHERVEYFKEEDRSSNSESYQAMTDTVPSKLRYIVGAVARAWDVYLQKEATNQTATASVTAEDTDGNPLNIPANLPATYLLGMETKLRKLREAYEHIPTLAPGFDWQADSGKGAHIYRAANQQTTFRTKRTLRPVELAAATKEHPAQVKAVEEDMNVARITRTQWSSMLSPNDKSVLLGRIDTLIRAFKKARQRANQAEVVQTKAGKVIFDYIHQGVV